MPTPSALVIVHLSSLDMFVKVYGIEEAEALRDRLIDAVLDHAGPVYVIDQRWPWQGDISQPRFEFVRRVELQREIRWTHFDDSRVEWEIFLNEFRMLLKEDGVKIIVLGGIWYSPEGAGCVSEAREFLVGQFTVRINPRLVGCIPSGTEV